jgi:hypothetical protein
MGAAMSKCTLHLKVHVRWWVKPYLSTLAMVAWISGRTPDVQKVGEFIARRGIRLEVQ